MILITRKRYIIGLVILALIFHGAGTFGYQQQAVKILPKEVENGFTAWSSQHFIIKFEGTHERKNEAVRILTLLEEAYKKIGADLNYYPAYQIPCNVYLSPQEFFTTALGVCTADRRRAIADIHKKDETYIILGHYDIKIEIPFSLAQKGGENLGSTLFHEYTHVVIDLIAKGYAPKWFHEGIAQYEDGRYKNKELDATRIEILAELFLAPRLVPLESLDSFFTSEEEALVTLAYLESYTAVKSIIDWVGLQGLRDILSGYAKLSKPFSIFLLPGEQLTPLLKEIKGQEYREKTINEAFYKVLNMSSKLFEMEYRECIIQPNYRPSYIKVKPRGEYTQVELLYSLAQNYEKNKRYDSAIEQYQKIIESYPDSSYAKDAKQRIKELKTK